MRKAEKACLESTSGTTYFLILRIQSTELKPSQHNLANVAAATSIIQLGYGDLKTYHVPVLAMAV